MPKAIAKSETASTASYNLASSPSLLQGHIQLAERDTAFIWSSKGAQTKLVSAYVMAFLLPAAALISAATGLCPMAVAMPSLPLKSKAITPQ